MLADPIFFRISEDKVAGRVFCFPRLLVDTGGKPLLSYFFRPAA